MHMALEEKFEKHRFLFPSDNHVKFGAKPTFEQMVSSTPQPLGRFSLDPPAPPPPDKGQEKGQEGAAKRAERAMVAACDLGK